MKGKIYKISNSVNNKIYIGQTTENNVERRYKNHLYASRESNPKNSLYRAIKKYGEDKFSIDIIEEVDHNLLDEREIHYIEKYNSYENGYNDTLGGAGVRVSMLNEEEVVNKYRELKHLGKTIEFFNSTYYIITKLLTNFGVEVEHPPHLDRRNNILLVEKDIWLNGLEECVDYLIDNKIAQTDNRESIKVSISRHLTNNTPYLGIRFVKDIKDIETCKENSVKRAVYQFSRDGQEIAQFVSLADAERATGISQKTIGHCCRGKQKTSGGFIWQFI